MTFIEQFTFHGKKDGPHILLTGCIHGNEPAGEFALKRLIGHIGTHDLPIERGTLTILPCCNPKAAKENKRYIDINLNRIMSKQHVTDHKDCYEAALATEIMAAADACDIAIDLHTFTEDMDPVVICIDDQNPASRDLAVSCGIKRILCDSPHISEPHTQMLLHYMRHQRKPAILIESGQHNDQDAIETAWHALLNILISHHMINGHPSEPTAHEFLVIENALYNREGEELIFPLMENDRLQHGDPVFKMADGTIINADCGGLLFMRNKNTPVGESYAYVCDILDEWP